MFTGIVREIGCVETLDVRPSGARIAIRAPEAAARTAPGDSVAVNGVCLTAVEVADGVVRFDAVPETLARTTLGRLAPDAAVNVESALRAGEPLGGHLVQGHVDGVGRVRSVEPEGDGARLTVELPPEIARLSVEKGSITLDGVSLTIAERGDDWVAIALVPHTLTATTLGRLQPGDELNAEADVVAKHVERLLEDGAAASGASPVTIPQMAETPATVDQTAFATIEAAIEAIREGRFVVVVDAADRENEGDLTIAAQFATPEAINFMATHGRGLICLCLTGERCDQLRLHPMTAQNETPFGTAFTVSIEAREGIATGISVADRSHTIQVAIDPSKGAEDLVRPGHVFPLRARPGGVLQRAGQTEAAVDLARLAGLNPAGVVCEIANEDGSMARVPDLIPYCKQHGILMVTVADLIEYRRRAEKLVERMTTVRLPTTYGEFSAVAFRETATGKHHLALVKGEIEGHEDVLVRVHSECLTGDVFHSLRCDCGEQLEHALARIGAEDRGVLLYMAQEGRGIGLLSKLKAYELQEAGLDTVEANLELGFPADAREYGIGSQILADLGLTTIRILTNNPRKISGIEGFGLTVVEQVPIEVEPNAENERYLETKREKLGHRLHHQEQRFEEPGA